MASDNGDGREEPQGQEREPKKLPRLPHGHVHTPTVLQMEAVECGAASLGIILAFYGKHVPLEQLRIDCGVSRDGSNAARVMDAAREHGMEADAYRMELEGFRDTKVPCIIFWEFNHFLVLEGFGRGKVYLNDPAFGRRVVTAEEFDRSFSGIVLTFHPAEGFKRGGRRPSVVRALASRLKGIRIAVTFCILAGLGSTLR